MNHRLKKIYFIHEGREAYPEIAAYRSFFDGLFETEEIRPCDLKGRSDLEKSICWFIMGFYPWRPKAGLVIHDYRSLSIGRLSGLKDKIKRYLNIRPDIRLYQNHQMQQALGLQNDVPTVFLPMGVPPFVAAFRDLAAQQDVVCDFCYIGVMSAERQTFLMLDSFLKHFGTHKVFHLYGEPEPKIKARYKSEPNIVFMGRHSQQTVFAALQKARVAVNYFPLHRPHLLQTPTKLLEYAALGLRILCNEHPRSRQVAQRYGISCLWGETSDMFAPVPADLIWPTNRNFDPSPLFWPSVIQESGIESMMAQREWS